MKWPAAWAHQVQAGHSLVTAQCHCQWHQALLMIRACQSTVARLGWHEYNSWC
jgi:hypothetical protein